MKLKVLQDFKGSENGIDVKEYIKGEIFETDNKEYYDNLIAGKLCADASNAKETKVIEPKEIK